MRPLPESLPTRPASYPSWEDAMRAQPPIRLSDPDDPFGRMASAVGRTPAFVRDTGPTPPGPWHGTECWCGRCG